MLWIPACGFCLFFEVGKHAVKRRQGADNQRTCVTTTKSANTNTIQYIQYIYDTVSDVVESGVQCFRLCHIQIHNILNIYTTNIAGLVWSNRIRNSDPLLFVMHATSIELYEVWYMGPSFIVSNCIELYDVVPYQCNPHKTIYFVTSKSKKSLIYDSLILFLPVDFILSFHKDRCRMVWTWIRSVKFASSPSLRLNFCNFIKHLCSFIKYD